MARLRSFSLVMVVIAIILLGCGKRQATQSDVQAFLAASRKGDSATVSRLFDQCDSGTLLAGKTKDRDTAFHLAARYGHVNVIQQLIEAEPKLVDIRGGSGRTPLACAACENQYDIARFLLSQGADPNSKEDGNQTPLYWAAYNGNPRLVELLLKHDGRVDERDKYGNTPLLMAVTFSHLQVIRTLVDHGADVNAKTPGGLTPYKLAVIRGNDDIVTLLRFNGGKF